MPFSENLHSLVRQFHLFDDISDRDRSVILDQSNQIKLQSGQVIFEQDDPGDAMYILLSGRVLIRMQQPDGRFKNLNVLQTGDHFGELSLLTRSRRTAMAKTLVDTELLVINKAQFNQYLNTIPAFAMNVGKQISRWLQNEIHGQSTPHQLHFIGLIRHSPAAIQLARQLVGWMVAHQRTVHVITDREAFWQHHVAGDAGLQNAVRIDPITSIQSDLPTYVISNNANDHCLLDLAADDNHTKSETTKRLLQRCERLFLLESRDDSSFSGNPTPADYLNHTLNRNCIIVSLQPRQINRNTENKPNAHAKQLPVMRMLYDPQSLTVRPQDISRLFHQIIDIHIGIALGGGGARALAHVGVLAALEENGLFADRIAGTSGGAIITGTYAAGFNFKQILTLFREEMTPPAWMRPIPNMTRWHLMALFRFGLIENRFRRHLDKLTLQSLLLPAHVVSADLISGKEVVRSDGDLVDGIMESINHPLLGRPIYRDGLCLVDGGVLNNVPSSVLRRKGCNFVISVDVGARIADQFGKNDHTTPAEQMKPVSYLGTLNRVLEIRGKGLDNTYKDHSDYQIEPDVSRFPFDNFTFGNELFEVGYQAALKRIPDLKAKYLALLKTGVDRDL